MSWIERRLPVGTGIGIGLALISAFLPAGCLETSTLIRVARDGSGTIEQTFLITSRFMELIANTDRAVDWEPSELVDEDELREQAGRIGKNVSLVSAVPVVAENGVGYTVTYRFEDVSKIRVNQNPGEIGLSSADNTADESQGESLGFEFTAGDPALLTVLCPPLPEGGGQTRSVQLDQETLQMIQAIYQDMQLHISVEVEGTIVATNAMYHDASVVTILAIDFGTALGDKRVLAQLATADPESVQELKSVLSKGPGISIEPRQEVTISFR